MDSKMWIIWAAVAGLCWGTYVPFAQQGIAGFQRNALASFLCVGIAYFLIAVLYPVGMFVSGSEKTPVWNMSGITFASLAGVAGALGALCVILATKAVPTGSDYRIYIGPIIFGLAPVLNTVISFIWHPREGNPLNFGLEKMPGWEFFVGILLTAIGVVLVLYSKGVAELPQRPPTPPVLVTPETPVK